MHDHGQVELMGQRQLPVEVMLLGGGIQPFHEEIQSAFAHGQRFLAGNPFAQCLQVFGLVRRQIHGVQAVSREQAGIRCTDFPQSWPA